MTNDSFAQRVQRLRNAWIERRQMKTLLRSVDFGSRYKLLAELHRWTTDAVDQIHAAYGDELKITIDPMPASTDSPLAFNVSVAGRYGLTFAMWPREARRGPSWYITVLVSSMGSSGVPVAAGPERRTGQWTRARLEELLLSLLRDWERTSEGDDAPSRGPISDAG